MKKSYNKLVRDRIANIIERSGAIVKIRTLKPIEFKVALKKKLVEESEELYGSVAKKEITSEIADILEVIDALMEVYRISRNELKKIKAQKRRIRGSFNDRVFLESVEE